MPELSYELEDLSGAALGLVVLSTDETIEQDFRRMLPSGCRLHVSRVPSAAKVSRESLGQMERHLTASARLFPPGLVLDAVGYGCTSGASVIGAGRVAELIGQGTSVRSVTDPLTALIAACRAMGIGKLAIVSPYVEAVSDGLRVALEDAGISTPAFGSFEEADEAKVVRIAPASVAAAAETVASAGQAEAVFLSCTNLRALDAVAAVEQRTGLPVLTSNQVLLWHMCRLSCSAVPDRRFGQLMRVGQG